MVECNGNSRVTRKVDQKRLKVDKDYMLKTVAGRLHEADLYRRGLMHQNLFDEVLKELGIGEASKSRRKVMEFCSVTEDGYVFYKKLLLRLFPSPPHTHAAPGDVIVKKDDMARPRGAWQKDPQQDRVELLKLCSRWERAAVGDSEFKESLRELGLKPGSELEALLSKCRGERLLPLQKLLKALNVTTDDWRLESTTQPGFPLSYSGRPEDFEAAAARQPVTRHSARQEAAARQGLVGTGLPKSKSHSAFSAEAKSARNSRPEGQRHAASCSGLHESARGSKTASSARRSPKHRGGGVEFSSDKLRRAIQEFLESNSDADAFRKKLQQHGVKIGTELSKLICMHEHGNAVGYTHFARELMKAAGEDRESMKQRLRERRAEGSEPWCCPNNIDVRHDIWVDHQPERRVQATGEIFGSREMGALLAASPVPQSARRSSPSGDQHRARTRREIEECFDWTPKGELAASAPKAQHSSPKAGHQKRSARHDASFEEAQFNQKPYGTDRDHNLRRPEDGGTAEYRKQVEMEAPFVRLDPRHAGRGCPRGDFGTSRRR
eukprot:TRINITY_DN37029_c0_g1_i1.p1 TRINITY_DN37029_c0_g1~~TRINITY_DN37029_c0_g1_i1.p1  ORF type:complete len:551 (+),score=136.91 TRINITY_DN37029_c0_g1_i1:71-1723(+)